MAITTKKPTFSAKVDAETLEQIEKAFLESGISTKDEFLKSLLARPLQTQPQQQEAPKPKTEPAETPKPQNEPAEPQKPQVIIELVEVEKELEENEILISLNSAQLFALREHVLSSDDFAEKQNKVIERLNNGDKPFFYSGNLFKPEFQILWVKNQILTNKMSEEEKEVAIKFNMCAFLMNLFFTKIVDGDVENSSVTPENLKAFILEQNAE